MADEVITREINEAVRQLLQAGRGMQATLGRRLGVRVTDVQAMDHVAAAAEPMGPVELGHRLGIRSASATALVNRLVAAGHLRRTVNPEDGRRVVVESTTEGRVEVRGQLAPMLDDLTRIGDDLDEAQAAIVLAYLRQATDAIHRYAYGEEP